MEKQRIILNKFFRNFTEILKKVICCCWKLLMNGIATYRWIIEIMLRRYILDVIDPELIFGVLKRHRRG